MSTVTTGKWLHCTFLRCQPEVGASNTAHKVRATQSALYKLRKGCLRARERLPRGRSVVFERSPKHQDAFMSLYKVYSESNNFNECIVVTGFIQNSSFLIQKWMLPTRSTAPSDRICAVQVAGRVPPGKGEPIPGSSDGVWAVA